LFYRIKRQIYVWIAAVFAVACFLGCKCAHITRLSAFSGVRTYYLDTRSSSSLRVSKLAFGDIFRVRGECVRFTATGESAESLAKKVDAEIVFTERAGDSVCYYAYSKTLGEGICLNGRLVNLQIAFHGDACAVGTPLIFDGF
jgi:hypothetical protein